MTNETESIKNKEKKLTEKKQCETVSCEICVKKIPASLSHSIETGDKIIYFCGIDCYSHWDKKNNSDDNSH